MVMRSCSKQFSSPVSDHSSSCPEGKPSVSPSAIPGSVRLDVSDDQSDIWASSSGDSAEI